MCKLFSTLNTLKRFLPCMYYLVINKMFFPCETLAALTTLKRFLSCMYSLVLPVVG